jgi:hypothetical protein
VGPHKGLIDDGQPDEVSHSVAETPTERPSGIVDASGGSKITWTIAADGTLTALGENNQQLVVSKYQPRRPPGTDAHGPSVKRA